MRRYGLLKALVPGVLALHALMAWLEPIAGPREIFPFFSWRLYSRVPDWRASEYAAVAHAIDGAALDKPRYLVPAGIDGETTVSTANAANDKKVLASVAAECWEIRRCDEAAEALLFPVVKRAAGGGEVEFSLIVADVDLRAARRDVRRLADGTANRADYYSERRAMGRWNTRTGRVWADGGESVRELLAASEPLLEAHFNARLADGALIFVRDQCSDEDLRRRFFLHVYPKNLDDIPEDRREYGFDNLDFSFTDYRYETRGICATVREIPDYPIDRVLTGQFISGEGHVWSGEIRFGDD